MSKKQLTINIFSNLISFAVSFGISFLFTPYLIETIGAETYGFYPLSRNFLQYVAIGTTALNSMFARFITIEIQKNNYETANKYFSTVFYSNIAISLFLAIIYSLVIINIQRILNIPNDLVLTVKLLFIFTFSTSIISLSTSVFWVSIYAKNRLDIRSGISIYESITRVVLLVSLFKLFSPNLSFVSLVALIICVITSSFVIYLNKKLLPEIKISIKNFDKKVIKLLIGSGIWNSINQLSDVLLNGLDLLISNIFIGPIQAGIYSIVLTLPNFIYSLINVIVNVFVPQFTIAYAKGNKEEILKEITLSCKILGIVCSLPLVFLVVYGDIFYSLWVPSQDEKLLHILSIIVVLPKFISVGVNTLFNVFSVTNKLKVPSIVMLSTGIINTCLVFVLLKSTNLGIFAVAGVSSVIGVIRNIIFTPTYAAHCLKVKKTQFYPLIIRTFIAISSSTIIMIILKNIIRIDMWIELILVSGIGSIVCLIVNAIILLSKQERLYGINIIKEKVFKKKILS